MLLDEYQQSYYVKATELEQQANAQGEKFAFANTTSTAYVRNTVLFATTLFVCSMAGRFDIRGVRLGLAGLVNAVIMARTW